MMNSSKLFLIFNFLISLTLLSSQIGCTEADPNIKSLSSLKSGISFDEESSKPHSISTSPTCESSLNITGKCDKRTLKILFSVDSGTLWTNISGYNSSSESDCSDKKFQLHLDNVCESFKINANQNENKYLLFKSVNALGESLPSQVNINFISSTSAGGGSDSTPPSSFTILGASGGDDTTSDSWLTNGSTVTISWTEATNASSYNVTIRNTSDTEDLCLTASAIGTQYIFSNCPLLEGVNYKIKVEAVNTAGKTIATNSSFSFTVNTTSPIAIISGAPVGSSNSTALNISVSGSQITNYKYVISNGNFDCSSETYSSSRAIATLISDSILSGFSDGIVKLCVIGQSVNGTWQPTSSASSVSWTKDVLAPTVSSVSSSTTNGIYSTGSSISIQVTFSESVTVNTTGGTPTLLLETGTTDQVATYSSGSGSTELTFNYTVQSGDTNPDLDYTSTTALSLNGGIFQDAASNNNPTPTLPNPGDPGSLAANKNIVIDTVAPILNSVNISNSSPTNSTTYNLTYGSITGPYSDYCFLENNTNSASCSWTTGSLPTSITVLSTNNAKVISAWLKDNAGNISSRVDSNSVTLDTTAPTISSVSSSTTNSTYSIGSTISIQVTFSESVTVNTTGGTPALLLETGTIDRSTTYSSGSGSNVLNFSYTVQSGDENIDLDYTSTTALSLNGGIIQDATSNNNPTPTLPNPGDPGSLAANKNIVIDTIAPILSSVNISNSSPTNSTTYNLTYGSISETYSHYCLLENNTNSASCSWTTGSLPASITVLSTNNAKVISAWLKDSVGNISSRIDSNSVTLDTTAPTISSVSSSTTNGTYRTGQTISIQITFSESVIVLGSPKIELETGTTDQFATYSSGSSSNTLNFNYTVQSGDTSLDLSYTSVATLLLNGGSIRDAASNDTSLTLPSLGNIGSLNYNNAIVIDTNPIAVTVDPVYPDYGLNWNDYVKYNDSNKDQYTQSGTNCDGTETSYYGEFNGCIHGGEKKKVTVTGYSSCNNLTITDSLGAFDWICISNSLTGNTATFFTKGLANGKGLKDLLTTSGAWQSISVNVKYDNTYTIANSTPVTWWNNATQDLSATGFNNDFSNPIVVDLISSGTIYYVSSSNRSTYGYHLGASKISVVTLGSTKLIKYHPSDVHIFKSSDASIAIPPTSDTRAILAGGSINFNWIEANMDGTATYPIYTGLLAFNWKYSRIHRTTISPTHTNQSFSAFRLNSSNYNLITGLEIYDIASGFELNGSDHNIIRNLSVANARYNNANCKSIYVTFNSDYNRFYDTRVSYHNSINSLSKAVYIAGTNNIFSRMNVSNIQGQGEAIFLTAGASSNIFSQLTATSTKDAGIYFSGSNVNSNIIKNAIFANNTSNGIYFNSGTYSNNNFISMIITNTDKGIQPLNNTGGVSGSNNNFTDIYIANNNIGVALDISGFDVKSNFSIFGNNTTNCSVGYTTLCNSAITEGDLTNAFIGKLGNPGDSQNPSDGTTGSASSLSSLGGFLYFENIFRNWGKDMSAFPNSDNRGFASSLFRIWDWRPSDPGPLYNKSFNGSALNTTIYTDYSACLAGTVSPTDTITVGSLEFLRTAIEIDGDDIGNNNALCESNENCFWTPNIGAYQGSGSLSTGYCTVNGGNLSGIKIFTYSTN